jgi:hypothetical protein
MKINQSNPTPTVIFTGVMGLHLPFDPTVITATDPPENSLKDFAVLYV